MSTLSADNRAAAVQADWPIRNLFGMPICAMSMDEVLSAVDETIMNRSQLLLGMVNAAKVVNMRRDPALREAVLASDMILADGMAVVWASRLLRRRLPERIAGIDLMMKMLERGNERGYRFFCLGAAQEVLEKVTATIAETYPNVNLVGSHHGFFEPEREQAIADQIAAARPDILFVAMSPPKKELFLARWARHMRVPVCHGVGGAFDVVAGKTRRAPEMWQKLGVEWLYRVKQEPYRLWRRYLVTNTLFSILTLREFAASVRRLKTNRI